MSQSSNVLPPIHAHLFRTIEGSELILKGDRHKMKRGSLERRVPMRSGLEEFVDVMPETVFYGEGRRKEKK